MYAALSITLVSVAICITSWWSCTKFDRDAAPIGAALMLVGLIFAVIGIFSSGLTIGMLLH